MNMFEAFTIALANVRSHRLRTALTTLGIVIGVAAVIVLVGLGDGMQAGFNNQFSRLANQITVTQVSGSPPGGGVARNLTDADVRALENSGQAPDISSVTPSMTGSANLTEGQATERANLIGATNNYLELVDRTIAAGNWFTSSQQHGDQKVAVIGQQAIGLLWGPGTSPDQVVGASLRVHNATFKVVGVLASDGQNDNLVIVPFRTARAYLVGNNNGQVNQILVTSTSSATVNQAANEITAILDKQHYITSPSNRDFNVTTLGNLLSKATQFLTYLTVFTVAIAGISLLVGAIGIANIMLVSVTERTREIGIRKAIGARRSAILKQFLIESTVLSGIGGLIGITIGVGITLGAAAVIPRIAPTFGAPQLSVSAIVIAFAISLLIGVIAGSYPARRAARLHPIDALRYE